MSDNETPRQSARLKKMTAPESVGDGFQAKEKQSGPSARGRKTQKPGKDSEAERVKEGKAIIMNPEETSGDGSLIGIR